MVSLASGTRLGPYEIFAPVGVGGMGEVYSALDTRLDRDVAIKVLPEHLAQSPAALARDCAAPSAMEQDGIGWRPALSWTLSRRTENRSVVKESIYLPFPVLYLPSVGNGSQPQAGKLT